MCVETIHLPEQTNLHFLLREQETDRQFRAHEASGGHPRKPQGMPSPGREKVSASGACQRLPEQNVTNSLPLNVANRFRPAHLRCSRTDLGHVVALCNVPTACIPPQAPGGLPSRTTQRATA